jgi:hypothetical protein
MRCSADCLTVAEGPETRFAETPSGRIAYQVVGDGPIDVLVLHRVRGACRRPPLEGTVLADHDALVQGEVERFRGQKVNKVDG